METLFKRVASLFQNGNNHRVKRPAVNITFLKRVRKQRSAILERRYINNVSRATYDPTRIDNEYFLV